MSSLSDDLKLLRIGLESTISSGERVMNQLNTIGELLRGMLTKAKELEERLEKANQDEENS